MLAARRKDAVEALAAELGGLESAVADVSDPSSIRALVERGRRFLRGVGAVRATRACARPVSADGRPLIGRLGEALYVCAGHGPWGISIGPASARLIADVILGHDVVVPPELDAARFPFLKRV